MNRPHFLLWVLCVPSFSEASEGRLQYASGGRTVDLQVLDAGHKALVTLAPVSGEAALVRRYFLTHTGPERLIVTSAQELKAAIPQAWKVSHRAGLRLLRNSEATFWCYTPGLVLPVHFKVDGREWRLVSADLAPKMFVAVRE